MGFRSQIVGLGHNGEAARPWLECCPPTLLVGRGADENSKDSLDLLPLHGADPNQRIGHRRALHVETVGRREGSVVLVVGVEMEALVEATVEGARVGGGADENNKDSLDLLPLHGVDPNQRIGHRRALHVETVGRREGGVVLVVGVEMEALVEATAEGARVGGGAHARTALEGEGSDRVGGEVVVGDGEGATGGGGGWEERERG